MSFEKNKFQVVKKRELPKSEFEAECNVALDIEAQKINFVSHKCQVENVEVLNGVINFSGEIYLCVFYQSLDGEFLTAKSACPFTSKFDAPTVTTGDKAHVSCEVTDYMIESVTPSSVRLSCKVMQLGTAIACHDIESVDSADDDICIKKDTISINTLVGEMSESLDIESEQSVKEQIKNILMCASEVCVKNAECGAGFVTVTGEVVTRVSYQTVSGRFGNVYLIESFKEEVEGENVTRDCVCDAWANAHQNNVTCEQSADEKGTLIKVTTPVQIKIFAYEEKDIEVIKDIYCTTHELEITTTSFDMTKKTQGDTFDEKIDGMLTLDADRPRVDKILLIGGTNLTILNTYLQNGEITLEGVVKVNVIYLNDEENSNNSVIMEVPFVVADKSSVACENVNISVDAILFDIDVSVKKGRDLYFDGKLKVAVSYDCPMVSAIISQIELKEELVERDCTAELVFAKGGMDAWDIAKAFKVKESMLTAQNPDVTFPLTEDTNIVLYYQKV